MINGIRKYLYITAGSIVLIIGFIGICLPIIPTTPLVMLACYLYGKSSERFYHWLIRTDFYKKYAKDFVENRQLTRKRKVILLTFASMMLLFPLFILQGIMKMIIVGVYGFLYYYFIFKIKTIKPRGSRASAIESV